MKTAAIAAVAWGALALAGCDIHATLMGFPEPTVTVQGTAPVELAYREGKGGLVILRGRVNGRADVEFILDTGAPVTVFIDGPRTAALGLDSTGARPLGDPSNPATPTGVIARGFAIDFERVAYSGLSAVVIPEKSLPCRERFDALGFGGVIGTDLFRRFVVEIDTGAKIVRLHEPASWRVPEGATILPLTFRGRHPFVETMLSLEGGKEIASRMNLDTGANRALTLVAGSHPALEMPAQGEVRKSCYVNGIQEERVGAPMAVTLGGQRIPVEQPVYTQVPNVVDATRSGTLGVTLFQGRRLIIDYPGSRVILG